MAIEIMDLPIKKVIVHNYVSFPEGINDIFGMRRGMGMGESSQWSYRNDHPNSREKTVPWSQMLRF